MSCIKILFVLFLYLKLSHCIELYVKAETCTLDKNFLQLFRKHARFSNTVIVQKISTHDEYDPIIDSLTNQIVKNARKNKNILINRYSYKLYSADSVNVSHGLENIIPPLELRYKAQPPKLRSVLRSMDIYTMLVTIVRNPIVLKEVQKKFMVRNKSRFGKILVFVEKQLHEDHVTRVLEDLWFETHALNTLAVMPCISQPNYVYVYDPHFLREPEKYGAAKKFKLKDVSSNPLTLNTLDDLHGYRINISYFPRNPTLELTTLGEFTGIDGIFLKILMQKMNFRGSFLLVRDKFGTYFNGMATGAIGDIIHGRSQLVANTMFLQKHGANDTTEYAHPMYSDYICVIVPKAPQIPQSLLIFKCFTLKSWIATGCIYILCMLIRYTFDRVDIRNHKIRDRSKVCFETLSMLLGTSVKLRNSHSQRIIIVACLIFALIINNAFQGNLIESFSTVSYYREIKNLEEFGKTDLEIFSTLKVLDYDNSSIISKLRGKKHNFTGEMEHYNTLAYLCMYKNISTLARCGELSIRSVTEKGKRCYHKVRENLMTYQLVHMVPKGWPYLNKFNNILMQFKEGGFVDYWWYNSRKAKLEKKQKHKAKPNRPMGLEEIMMAFCVLIAGCFVSTVVFFIEILYSSSKNVE